MSKKIEPHENSSSSQPPTTMPRGMPSAATAAQMPIAFARSSRGKTSTSTDRVDGMISAPPTPCAARAAMSCPLVSESAAARLAAPKIRRPASSARRRPKRSPSVPMVRSSPANTRMYALTIHCSDAADASRSRCSVGIATLRMVTSSAITRRLSESTARVQ